MVKAAHASARCWRVLMVWASAAVAALGLAAAGALPAAASTGGYPYASASCYYGNAGGAHCANPSDPGDEGDWYDWGYWHGNVFDFYDQWGYEYRNCTSYVAWRLASAGVSSSLFSRLGNADQWIGAVSGKPGVRVNSTPAPGAVAVWDSPGVGHVAWVESVSGKTVTVSDYNYAENGLYDEHAIASTPSGYIHFPGTSVNSTPILSSVSSLRTPDGYIHVFSGNSTGSVWETWFGHGHSSASDLLGTPTGSPVTSIRSMYTPDGYIHVFAGMKSGDVYEFYFGNGKAPKWDLLGDPDGQPVTSVSSMRTPDGYIHVFSSTSDGYVWETWFGNGHAPVTDQLANLSG